MKIAYDYFLWYEYAVLQIILIELYSHPSLLITGSSGTGKSYALKYMMKNLLQEQVILYFCNFKKSADFQFLQKYSKYFTYLKCVEGLEGFYAEFKKVQEQNMEFKGYYHILVFDEFPAFILAISMQDKKLAERYKMMISEILMLGRSYGFGIWLVMQRPDSSLLANGARDNFHTTISLGNLSKEAKSMLYSGEELPQRVYKKGEGVCWIDGAGLKEIKFPKICDIQLLESDILNRL